MAMIQNARTSSTWGLMLTGGMQDCSVLFTALVDVLNFLPGLLNKGVSFSMIEEYD